MNLAAIRARSFSWAVCAFVLWGWLISGVVAGPALERIKSKKAIVIGHRESSIPFSYVHQGRPIGYALDICSHVIEAVRSHLKLQSVQVKHVQITPSNRVEVVANGGVDLESVRPRTQPNAGKRWRSRSRTSSRAQDSWFGRTAASAR